MCHNFKMCKTIPNILFVFLLVQITPKAAHAINTVNNTIKHHPAKPVEHLANFAGMGQIHNGIQRIKMELNGNEIHPDSPDSIDGGNSISLLEHYVVEDWQSVCQQLCGAGLGGERCGSSKCKQIETEQSENVSANAIALLGNKKDIICQDLCKYQFGGQVCDCRQNNVTKALTNWNHNQICYIFCVHREIVIFGCRGCFKPDLDTEIDNNVGKLDEITTPIMTTTPNWQAICKILCKTGDGGALCNCDKPPFF